MPTAARARSCSAAPARAPTSRRSAAACSRSSRSTSRAGSRARPCSSTCSTARPTRRRCGAHGGEPRGPPGRRASARGRHRDARRSASASSLRCGRLVDDADELGVAAGEEDALRGERDRLRHLDRLVEAAASAADRVNPEEGAGALSLAGDATHALEGAAELDPALATPLADLQEAVTRLREAGVELRRYLQELEAQPGRLDQVEARLAQLAETARRHDAASGDELAARADEARALLESLGPADQEEARCGPRSRPRSAELTPRPTALHELRVAAAAPFARAVESHLADLGMEHATLEVRLSEREPGPRGADDVELLLQANPGLAATPIARTASGGELSRIALAVRLAARDRSARPTLVFDEVDAGVGGRTARALGEKLLRLSEHTQLLCITHLPQIAALAERHFRVVKTAGEPSETRIDELAGDAVIEELVRMLGADVGDPDARALAVSLRSA